MAVRQKQGTKRADSPISVAITAEIPAVGNAEQARRNPGYPAAAAPVRPRRRPAPFAVRVFVWILAFLLVLAGVGLWAEHYHPAWFAFIQNKVGSAQPVLSTPKTNSGSATVSSSSAPLNSGTPPGSVTVTVPPGPYSIVVASTHAYWMKVVSPAGSSTVVFEQVVPVSTTPKTLEYSSSITVSFAASTTSLSVISGGHTVKVIPSPHILPITYTFTQRKS